MGFHKMPKLNGTSFCSGYLHTINFWHFMLTVSNHFIKVLIGIFLLKALSTKVDTRGLHFTFSAMQIEATPLILLLLKAHKIK